MISPRAESSRKKVLAAHKALVSSKQFKFGEELMKEIEEAIRTQFIGADEFDDFAMFRIETFFKFINSVELAVTR